LILLIVNLIKFLINIFVSLELQTLSIGFNEKKDTKLKSALKAVCIHKNLFMKEAVQ
jgi:hypothetical protein